jgi:hypothetical protein
LRPPFQTALKDLFVAESAQELSDSELVCLAEGARQQLMYARTYSLGLLDSIPLERWFEQPQGCPTHIAWQVGHVATAQYLLTLFRVRGKEDADEQLIPKAFLKEFGKGSQAQPATSHAFSASDIKSVFDRVFSQVVQETANLEPDVLRRSVILPYAVYPMILGSLLMAPHHEILHAGQIGLVRRLLGLPSVR